MLNFKKARINKKKLLGKGTSGAVYPYQKEETDERWAVKIIKTDTSQELLDSFKEIALGFSCDHPNVLPVRGYLITYDRETDEAIIHMKIPRTKTQSLKEILNEYRKDQKMIPELQIAQYFYELVCGLQYLHQRGIAHRDIKPANILFDKTDGRIRIADFGIGDLLEGKTTYTLAEKAGDPYYAAPENFDLNTELRKKDLFMADLWSLGMALFELCTRMELREIRKLAISSTKERLQEHLKENLHRLEEKKEYSGTLITLIESLLRYNPLERKSLKEIEEELVKNYGTSLNYTKHAQTGLSDVEQDLKRRLETVQKESALIMEEREKRHSEVFMDLEAKLDEMKTVVSLSEIVQSELKEKEQNLKIELQEKQREIDEKETNLQRMEIELEVKLKEGQKLFEEMSIKLEETQRELDQSKMAEARLIASEQELKVRLHETEKKLEDNETNTAKIEMRHTQAQKEVEKVQEDLNHSLEAQKGLEDVIGQLKNDIIMKDTYIAQLEKKFKDTVAKLEEQLNEMQKEPVRDQPNSNQSLIQLPTGQLVDQTKFEKSDSKLELILKQLRPKWEQEFELQIGNNRMLMVSARHNTLKKPEIEDIIALLKDLNEMQREHHTEILQGLSIPKFDEANDQNAKDLASYLSLNFSFLKQLNISFSSCENITDQGVKDLASYIGTSLTSLQQLTLDLSWCEKITDEAVKSLASLICNNLTSLEMFDLKVVRCTGVTEECLKDIRKNYSTFRSSKSKAQSRAERLLELLKK